MEDNKKREQIAEMLIRFYNAQAGTSFRAKNTSNQSDALYLYDAMKGDVTEIKNYIRRWVSENPEKCKEENSIRNCFDDCFVKYAEDSAKKQQVDVKQEMEKQVQYSMSMLEKAVIQIIAETNADKIEKEIMGSVENKVNQFIKDEYGTIERRIITIVDGKKAEMKGVLHDKFDEVLKYIANDEAVYLSGPAGSGKNVICEQVAEALGLNFYFTNAVTQEYQLKGFTDAMGNYQPTQFYKAFTEGGLFMLESILEERRNKNV